MKTSIIDMRAEEPKRSLGRTVFLKVLNRITNGYITVKEDNNTQYFGDCHSELKATITITNSKTYSKIIWGGSIGAAEAYVEGWWSTDNLTNVIRIFSRHLQILEKYQKKFGLFSNMLNLFKHRINRNSKTGSRTNIASHYDLSNDMYRLFLDPHMQYSSAVFPSNDSSLEEAQQHKMKTICDYLDLNEDDHLLEVGTGWGGLACYAAKHYGCKVTTTTISPAQFEVAKSRIKSQHLDDKISLILEDYRDLKGQYSKIVSVEMIEAVGHEYMDEYFRMLNTLLKPGGKLMIQSITINDQRYDSYRNNVDFIQRYIFPGGHLPSVSLITENIKRNTDMHVDHLIDYRLDYAKTLAEWRHRFLAHKHDILALGFNEDFIRLWEFYFCYCEGGFREKVIGLAHVGLIKSEF
jgi:cyclopropane-fatty-acyl-phospholipid synthase